jgi:hypothetical protein
VTTLSVFAAGVSRFLPCGASGHYPENSSERVTYGAGEMTCSAIGGGGSLVRDTLCVLR